MRTETNVKLPSLSEDTAVDLQPFLDSLMQGARLVVPFDGIGVLLWDEAQNKFNPYFVDCAGARDRQVSATLDIGVAQLVTEKQQSILIDEYNTSRFRSFCPAMNAAVYAPIHQQEKVVGLLVIESYTKATYASTHQSFAETLAGQIAAGLEMTQRYHTLYSEYTQLQMARRELALHDQIAGLLAGNAGVHEMLVETAQILAEMGQADACTITLWDEQRNTPLRLAAWGINCEEYLAAVHHPANTASLTSVVVKTAKPVIVNNALALENPPSRLIREFNTQALVALPLITRGKVIGTVFLLRIQNSTPFYEAIIADLQTPLAQVALAIDNQRLLSETQHRVSETGALLEIAAIASGTTNLKELLNQVIQLTKTMLGTQACLVLLHEQDTVFLSALKPSAGFNDSVYQMRFSLNASNSLLGKVFYSGQPHFINVITDLIGLEGDLAEENKFTNMLAAPLRVQDHSIGVLLVANRTAGFSYAEANLLMALGTHVAAALRSNELLAATRMRLRETEVLQQIAAITSETIDLDDMLARAIRATADLFDVEGAVLLLPHLPSNTLRVHRPSISGVVSEMMLKDWDMLGPGHVVHVYHTGQPYVSNDAPSDISVRRHNVITVPLNTRRRTLGVLSLIDRRGGKFERIHLELAIAIASQIAVSMESAQLFAAERHRADQMSIVNQISQELTATLDPIGLMRKVGERLHQLLNYEVVYVLQLDAEAQRLILRSQATSNARLEVESGLNFPMTQGISGRGLREGRTQVVNNTDIDNDFLRDIEGLSYVKSILSVPLRRDKTLLGVVNLGSTRKEAFDDTDRALMETLATQISSALENARLYNQAQKRLLEQGIVHQIGQDLTSILDYNELINAVARHMARALDTSSCVVGLFFPQEEAVRIEADYRLPGKERKTVEALEIGQILALDVRPAMARAIHTRRTVIVYRDDEKCPEEQREVLKRFDEYSQLVVPMIVGDRIIGIVDWMERRRPRIFTRDDERLALTLVSQASIAVENARLYRESERRAKEQSLLRQLALRLGSITGLSDLLEYLVREAMFALEASNVAIGLVDDEGEVNRRVFEVTTLKESEMVMSKLVQRKDTPKVWNAMQMGESVVSHTRYEADNPAAAELRDLSRYTAGVVMLAPINRRGRIFGFLEVTVDDRQMDFEGHKRQFLESLTDQAAIAIDNLRLYQREQRRLRQIERVQASGRLISSELVMQNLLDLIVGEAAGIFEVSAVALEMPNADLTHYEIRTAHGLSQSFIQGRRILVESRIQPDEVDLDALHLPYYIADLASYEESFDPEQAKLVRQEALGSVLIVPLVKGTSVLGHLNLFVHKSIDVKYRFSEEDIEIAQLLASQVTIALENARLFQELEVRAIELAEANRLKSQFLATMSHELRTPMNSILGFSDTLLSGIYGDLNEKQRGRVERILRNGRNLLALIDDLLDISKIDAGRMEIRLEPVSIVDEIKACVLAIESQAQSKNLYLKLDFPAETLPPVMADSLRLRQVITNLLGNAVKFTKEGGIRVKVEMKVLTEADWQEEPMIWTSVIDTGIGIQFEDQKIIFDEFRQADGSTTRQYGGTGLGLAISRRLIELMHGRIWVESETGRGSTFTFALPTRLLDTEASA